MPLSFSLTRRLVPVLFLLCACSLWQCAGRAERLQGEELYYNEGKRAIEKKRYTTAIEKLQRLVSNFPGSPHVAEAQFLLAEAHFFTKDFVNAVFEYQRLVDGYPSVEWVPQAQFKIAESYFLQSRRPELDQKETYDALGHYRRFIEDYPEHELAEFSRKRIVDCRSRLAKKQHLNGRLYHRQGYLAAAVLAYEEVLRDYTDTPWYYRTLLQMGDVKLRQGKTDEARTHWQECVRVEADEDTRQEANQRLQELSASAE